MADSNRDEEDNLTMEEVEVMSTQLALDLKMSIQNLQHKFDKINHHLSIVSELKKDHELYKRYFEDIEFIRLEALEKVKLNTSMLILLKNDMETLKSQEEDLNQKLTTLIKKVQESNKDRISITLLSRKLKLIKYYYVSSGWKHRRDDTHFEEDVSKDSRVRNKLELESEILELIKERRNEVEKARKEGNKVSYIQWISCARKAVSNVNRRRRLNWIQATVTEIFRLICSQLVEIMMFFFALKEWKFLSKLRYLKHIFRLLILLQHQGETMLLGKIVSVIDYVDEEQSQLNNEYMSVKILQGRAERVDDDYNENDNDGDFDLILELLLREVLCLESIVTYPIFSVEYDYTEELVIGSSLNHCMEQVKQIVSKVNGLPL